MTAWTVARPAPLSKEFSRQEYWSGLTLPPPGGIFPTQGLHSGLLHLQVDSLPSEPPGKPMLKTFKFSLGLAQSKLLCSLVLQVTVRLHLVKGLGLVDE